MASIVDGLRAQIDRLLELESIGEPPQYRLRTHCTTLSNTPPLDFDGQKLINEILSTFEENWQKRVNSKPSKENWILRQRTNLSSKHTGAEVPLERVVANLFRLTRDLNKQSSAAWGNQVPVASGVIDSKADTHMNIDLVNQRAAVAFDLMELKVRSDTPLYAGIEILIYGAAFLFWRLHLHDLGGAEPVANSNSLLTANDLRVAVLAPASYYKPFNLNLCVGVPKRLYSFGPLGAKNGNSDLQLALRIHTGCRVIDSSN